MGGLRQTSGAHTSFALLVRREKVLHMELLLIASPYCCCEEPTHLFVLKLILAHV